MLYKTCAYLFIDLINIRPLIYLSRFLQIGSPKINENAIKYKFKYFIIKIIAGSVLVKNINK